MNSPAISTLPPEILGHIFLYTIADERDSLACVPVSHVCTLWRAIALDLPRLWARIPTDKPLWASEMLLRSKSAPLSILLARDAPTGTLRPKQRENIVFDPARRLRHSLDHIFYSAHAARIEDLCVHGVDTSYAQDIIRRLVSAAALPLRLHLDCSATMRDWPQDEGSSALFDPVLSPLFTSHLHTLRLKACPISWDLPPLPRIETLHISYLFDHTRPTLASLLDFLARTPSLGSLELVGSLPLTSSPPAPDSRKSVHLAALRSLRLGGTADELVYFLRSVTFPRVTDLRIMFKGQMSFAAMDSVEAMLSSISSYLSRVSGKLLIDIGDNDVHLRTATNPDSETGTLDLRGNVSLFMTSKWLLEALRRYMPLERVTEINVDLTGGQSHTAVRGLFTLPAVTNLTISYLPWNFEVFMRTPVKAEEPWPHLKVVAIDVGLLHPPLWERSVDSLEHWLRWRRDRGARMPRLFIGKALSNRPASERSRLESIVQVEWEEGVM
ncbi:hypothetical protein PLICRDRAFT_417465 [Plicaturopsis crispa FD-325 SS-3]|nr:hypothetical protein PLICRDRAFT_417465 [Plicaturopsis crispa FD-325 SS-3]